MVTCSDQTSPDSDLGKLSADLLSQDIELQELKKELAEVNRAFECFKTDYSNLLTQYNETNDELQALLHERSKEETGPGRILADMESMSELLVTREKCKELEIEKEKYREMYLAAVQSIEPRSTRDGEPRSTRDGEPRSTRDTEELRGQVRDLSQQIQELEMSRDKVSSRLQYQIVEKEGLLDEINMLKRNLEELETCNMENEGEASLYKEQVMIKNSVIEKLRGEYTELGDENTRLRAQMMKVEESKENRDQLLNSVNLNNEDMTKDYEALQYRCSETEKREQEALIYIKDCLKLVEQTQLEKEQLVIQAAQSENMRMEVEGTLESIVEEASRRTLDEVERIRAESNKNIAALIEECGGYQERVAELEAELEEMRRCKDLDNGDERAESVVLADRDATIFKLREHIAKVEDDKAGLTDQLLEVSNTLRASKEHFQSKIKSLEYHLSSTKDKLSRTVAEKQVLVNQLTDAKNEITLLEESQRVLRSKMVDLQGVVTASEKQNSVKMKELLEEEGAKREEVRRSHTKIMENMRQSVMEKQRELNQIQEQHAQSEYQASCRENELKTTIGNLNRKLKAESKLTKRSQSDLDRLRLDHERSKEKASMTEARLKATDAQLNIANKQVADLTESETALRSKIKELQLRVDQLEFDMGRSKNGGNVTAGVLNHSSLGNLMVTPSNKTQHHATRDNYHATRDISQRKRDKKEKEKISKIFSTDVIRSAKRDKHRVATSSPKSESTIKFVDNEEQHIDISHISDQT